MKKSILLNIIFEKMLSEKTKEQVEKIILALAITSFIVHLLLIYLVQWQIIHVSAETELFRSPIAAIYTPFSFILVYEVYLLVFYMPKSVTTYVGKQYEIITLIVIRRLFKDFSKLELTTNWLEKKGDLQFTYDIILSILVFFIIYLFKKNIHNPINKHTVNKIFNNKQQYFLNLKKTIAIFLVPVLIVIAIYSFLNWLAGVTWNRNQPHISFLNINNIFFEQFFTILIIVDVLLLLLSFFYTDSFHKVIRNSGFIISTILIRLSFSKEGLLNNILILSSIIFGLLILMIHNQFEKLEVEEDAI